VNVAVSCPAPTAEGTISQVVGVDERRFALFSAMIVTLAEIVCHCISIEFYYCRETKARR
jgi:hypothetical protein